MEAKCLDGLGEVSRPGQREGQRTAGHRMRQLELRCVERLPRQVFQDFVTQASVGPPQAQYLFDTPAVDRIADHRVADVSEMDPDLMSAARVEVDLEARRGAE